MSDPTDPSRNPQRDFAVGLTVLAGLAVAAVLIVSFAGVKNWVKRGYDVTVHLPRAQGLAQGSTVYLAGVPIGTVGRVAAERKPDGTYGIRAVAQIDRGIVLPASSTVELNEQILGGVSRLIFFADKADPKGATLPTDGTASVAGKRSNLAIEMADNIMGGGDTGASNLMGNARELMLSLKKTTDRIGDSFEPVDASKLARGEAQPNIHTLIVRMNALVSHTDEVVADPKLRADLKDTLAATKSAATNLDSSITSVRTSITSLGDKIGMAVDSTSGQAKQTLEQTRATLTSLEKKYGDLANELNKTAKGVNTLLDAVNNGDGTAGKLIHDPALYENLNDAAQRLDKAFEEVRQLVEKVKKEGVDLKLK